MRRAASAETGRGAAPGGFSWKSCAAVLRRLVRSAKPQQPGLLDALSSGQALSRHRAGDGHAGRSRDYVLDPYRGRIQVTNVTFWH